MRAFFNQKSNRSGFVRAAGNALITFNAPVDAVCTLPSGKTLVGGQFRNFGGKTSRDIFIGLNTDNTVDVPFCQNASDGKKFRSHSGSLLPYITHIAPQSDGKILICGRFNYGDVANNTNHLIRLNPDGTLDTDFCNTAVNGAKFNNLIRTIFVQPDGKILVGGDFTSYGGTSGRNYLIRLNADGTLDTDFCNIAVDGAKFSSLIYSVVVQSNNKILVGGNFTTYAGASGRSRLIRLNADGTVDTDFCINAVDGAKFNTPPQTIAIQSDGKILLGGLFTYNAITTQTRLIRLFSDGIYDPVFDGKIPAGGVGKIHIAPDGQIWVGGGFSTYNSVPGQNYLVRIDSSGNETASFTRLNNGLILNAVTDSVGRVLIGGSFLNYSSASGRNRLVRFLPSGTVDESFCNTAVDGTKFNGPVRAIVIQTDGKILVGGDFTSYGGTSGRNYLIRLNADGTLDTDFCNIAVDGAKFNAPVYSITIQQDGKTLIGGSFFGHNSVTNRNRLVRLNADATLDTDFCINAVDGAKLNGLMRTIAVQSDGKILVGGDYTNYGAFSGRNRLIRLNPDGTLDTDFCNIAVDSSKFNNGVYSICIQSNGKILVGGLFSNYRLTNRSYLVRLESDGAVDSQFCENASDNSKISTVVQSINTNDGKILVGGFFTLYQGSESGFIVLNPDGTQDNKYRDNTLGDPNYPVLGQAYSVAVGNGYIYVAGNTVLSNYGSLVVYDKDFNCC